MELPRFLKIFEGQKVESSQTPIAPEIKLVPIEQELDIHHSRIEDAVSRAVGEPQPKGSSIPTANMTPGNPLGVIQGLDKKPDSEVTATIIDSTMPDSYKKSSVGDKFGDMKNTLDHLTGLDANRYTSADKFAELIQKKAQAKAAILQPEGELKKAA
jgi:hypothetical protein